MTHHEGSSDCAVSCPLANAADGMVGVEMIGESTAVAGGIGRRAFLSRGMLAAASVALAACGTGMDSISGPGNVSGFDIKVADYSALASVGGVALISASGSPIAVVRTGQSTFVALSRVCPHEGTIVGQNSGGGFICPRHGARFSSTGAWLGGQPTSNMHAYGTSYDATTGTLTIG